VIKTQSSIVFATDSSTITLNARLTAQAGSSAFSEKFPRQNNPMPSENRPAKPMKIEIVNNPEGYSTGFFGYTFTIGARIWKDGGYSTAEAARIAGQKFARYISSDDPRAKFARESLPL
jgi:hypothetical protein